MGHTLEPDIAAMNLTEGEKWGLQIFRNYSQAFGEHRIRAFVEMASSFENDVQLFEQISKLLIDEEVRVLPVIVAAYADDRLGDMFKREIPDGVPGGRNALMSGFGPLARLSQRIQMAFAFGWLSKDLLTEFDHIRKARNDLSHKWDVELLAQRMNELIQDKQTPIEQELGDDIRLPKNFHEPMPPEDRFRVRMIWMLGRLTYETRLWVPALKAGIEPTKALYGPFPPLMLKAIAAKSVSATRTIANIAA